MTIPMFAQESMYTKFTKEGFLKVRDDVTKLFRAQTAGSNFGNLLNDAHTIDGLWTFDRDPDPPFAVASGSAYVANLDADKLDSYHAVAFPRKAEAAVITGAWDIQNDLTISGSGAAANLALGADDTRYGITHLYGAGTGSDQGGVSRLYTAADHDAAVNYWDVNVGFDDLRIIRGDAAPDTYMTFQGGALMIDLHVNTMMAGSAELYFRDTELYIESRVDGWLSLAADTGIEFHPDNVADIICVMQQDLILVYSTNQLQFRDTAIHIESANDGYLDITADTGIRLHGNVSLTGNITMPEDGWIGITGPAERLVFDGTGGLITVTASHLRLDSTNRAQFGDAGTYIYQSADSILSYVADGRHEFTGGPVYVGTGTPGHTITGAGDLYVADRFEVDGAAYFDAAVFMANALSVCETDNLEFRFRSNTYGGLRAQADDGLHFYVYGGLENRQNRNLILCDYVARGDDYDHSSISADPTLFIHSTTRAGSATDEWWSIAFPVTHALYSVGSGWHEFAGDILSPSSAKHYFDAGAAQGTEYITSGADTYLDLYHAGGGGARFYDENNLLLTVSRLSVDYPTYAMLNFTRLYFKVGATPVLYLSDTLAAFSGDVYVAATKKFIVRPATEYAHSADAGHYDIEAGTSIDLNADTAVTGDITVSGTVDGVDVAAIPSTYMPKGGGIFAGHVTMNLSNAIRFGDAQTYIQQGTDGHLDLVADVSIDLNGDVLSPSSAKHYFDAGASQGTEYITSGADTYLDLYADASVRVFAGVLLGADNRKLVFGAGSDAEVYFNGSHLVIDPDPVTATATVYIGATADDNIHAAKFFIGTSTTVGMTTGGGAGTNLGLIADGNINLVADVETRIGDAAVNYTKFAADGELTLHGTARTMDCHEIDISSVKRPAANPMAEGLEDGFPTLDADDTTDESVLVVFHVPHGYYAAGAMLAHFDVFVDTAPVGAANVVYGVEYKKVSHGDNFDFAAGTASVVSIQAITTGTPANDKKTHQIQLALVTAGWAADDTIYMRVYRDANHASDTVVGDCRIIGQPHVEWLRGSLGEAT